MWEPLLFPSKCGSDAFAQAGTLRVSAGIVPVFLPGFTPVNKYTSILSRCHLPYVTGWKLKDLKEDTLLTEGCLGSWAMEDNTGSRLLGVLVGQAPGKIRPCVYVGAKSELMAFSKPTLLNHTHNSIICRSRTSMDEQRSCMNEINIKAFACYSNIQAPQICLH